MDEQHPEQAEPTSAPETLPEPKELATPFSLPGHPATNKAAARKLYGAGIGGMVFGNAVSQRIGRLCNGVDLADGGCNFMEDTLDRMAPRDPLEEMLIIQAALAHSRVLHLTEYANRQERLESIRTVNEYADRASNTFRRLMLALAEYRRPPKAGPSFTAIQQANIAGQQVVNNGGAQPDGNATNEQGCEPPDAPKALPAESGGSGILAGLGRPREAVGAVQRAEDDRREGPQPDERLAAR